jgi:hypothetical protein
MYALAPTGTIRYGTLAGVAQLVAHPTCNRKVPGSIPGVGSTPLRGSWTFWVALATVNVQDLLCAGNRGLTGSRPTAMRRTLTLAIIAVALTAGCAQQPRAQNAPAQQPGTQNAPAPDWPAGVKEFEVYEQVLRRYLGTPGENSFPANTFKAVYVLDRAYPDAANSTGSKPAGTPITATTQAHLIAALAQTAPITFVADGKGVIDSRNGCAFVKNDGILITLGTIDGDDNQATVGINGFVACLGATWLTYVVRNQPGQGWTVTGTTGTMAVA